MSIEAELLILPDVKDSDLTRAINKIDSAFKRSAKKMQTEYRKAALAGTLEGINLANKRMGAQGLPSQGGPAGVSTTTTNIYNQGAGGIPPGALAAGALLYSLRPTKASRTLSEEINKNLKSMKSEEKKSALPDDLDLATAMRYGFPSAYRRGKQVTELGKTIGNSMAEAFDKKLNEKKFAEDYEEFVMTRQHNMAKDLGRLPTRDEMKASFLSEWATTPEGQSYARRELLRGGLRKMPSFSVTALAASGAAAISGYEAYQMMNQFLLDQSGQRLQPVMAMVNELGGRKEPEIIAEAKRLNIPLGDVYAAAQAWNTSPERALAIFDQIQQATAIARHTGDTKDVFGKNLKEGESEFDIANRFTKATPDKQRVMIQQYPFLKELFGKETYTETGLKKVREEGKAEAKKAEDLARRVEAVREKQLALDELRVEAFSKIDSSTLQAYFDLRAQEIREAGENAKRAKEDAEQNMKASENLKSSSGTLETAVKVFSDAVDGMIEGMKFTTESAKKADKQSQSLANGPRDPNIPWWNLTF